MLPSSAAVKSTAKVSVKGKWPAAITASVVLMLTFFLGTFLGELILNVASVGKLSTLSSVLIAVYQLLITVPLFLGVLRWFWCITAGHSNEIKEIFIYFSSIGSYMRVFRYTLLFILRVALCLISAFLPSGVARLLTYPAFYGTFGFSMPMWSANLPVVADFLEVIGFVLFLFLVLRLYLSPLLLVIDDDMDPSEAFHISILISRDFLMNFVLLGFSFVGWFLLSLLGIPMLYTVPLFLACFAVHSRYAINYYNAKVKRWQQSNFAAYRSDFRE